MSAVQLAGRAAGRGPAVTSRPVGVRTRQRSPVSACTRAATSSRPRPSAISDSSCRCRPSIAASRSPRSPATAATTRSVMSPNDDPGRHLEQRQAVPAAGVDDVVRDRAEQRVAGGQRGRARLRRSRRRTARCRRAAAPDQPGQHQLAAGQVLARVEQVRGADPAQRLLQRVVVAVQQPKVELRSVEQVPQSHEHLRRSLEKHTTSGAVLRPTSYATTRAPPAAERCTTCTPRTPDASGASRHARPGGGRMDFLQPGSWAEALAAKAEHPDAVPHRRRHRRHGRDQLRPPPPARAARPDPGGRAGQWATEDGRVRLGAGVTYTRVIDELGDLLPGLAMASRTVGSPQIRNRGTVGGNLGRGLAGRRRATRRCWPPTARSRWRRRAARRRIPIAEFYTGVKRNALAPDELIAAVWITPPSGPQQFCKIGTRNAMVIAVAAFGLALHPDREQVGTGIGSAAPTPRRAPDAEAVPRPAPGRGRAVGQPRASCRDALAREFGDRVRAAASPIDDVRGSAGLPAALAVGDGPPRADLGLGRLPEGGLSRCASPRPSTASAARSTTCGRARACSTCCASGWDCRARRTPASRASAARARSTSTACRSARAWSPPGRRKGRELVTVEGLADGEALHPVQQAFVEAGAVQCGFCTPGLLVAAHDLLARNPSPSDPQIREALAGNLCRCTGYEKILDAVRLAAERMAHARDDAVVEGAAVVTMDAGRTEHPTGHVVVDGNRVVAVGAGRAPDQLREGAEVRGRVRLPGHAGPGQHPPPPLPVGRPAGSPSTPPVRVADHALPGLGGHRRGRRARRGQRRAGLARPHRLHHDDRPPLRLPPRGRRRVRRGDRCRTAGRAAVPPVPRLDGPRPQRGRPAAGPRRRATATTMLAGTDAAISRWHDPSPGAMVRVAVAPCSPFSVTGELMREAAELARRAASGCTRTSPRP